MDAQEILLVTAAALAGGLVCWVYCLLVRYSVSYLVKEQKQTAKFLGLLVIRFAIIGIGFFGALRFGTWPVVGYIAGFFIARTVLLSRPCRKSSIR